MIDYFRTRESKKSVKMSQPIQDCLKTINIRYPGSPQSLGLQELIERGELVNLLTANYPRVGLCSRLDSGESTGGGVQFIPELTIAIPQPSKPDKPRKSKGTKAPSSTSSSSSGQRAQVDTLS